MVAPEMGRTKKRRRVQEGAKGREAEREKSVGGSEKNPERRARGCQKREGEIQSSSSG